ncbi:metallophosphoesterase [Nocardioides sp. KIGAM211]|uniref:Metallophosphoesterase n=1 Tax=Nocardioides luti TaxID=2761101 RepID=A0A7X0V9Q4_9ACTN|nr:metallophosphoesterase [Nocardioides luti]MBB6626535.1 metallophosphoesterase [Nocardioides luti]
MEFSRRDLFRSAGALGALAAFSGVGGLAAEAVAGTGSAARGGATLGSVIAKGKAGKGGWRPLVRKAGEPHRVRATLGTAKSGRQARRTALLAFVQLSDVHIVDAQSPMRLESGEGVSSSAYRPQEILTAHIAESMVREINAVGKGVVTGRPLDLALQTGDNSDNSQYNEIRWNIDLLDGGRITPDSGDLTRYEGVMDGNPDSYDTLFWHPHGTPKGKEKDVYRKDYGFPKVPGLLDDCRRPFSAHGLGIEWIAAMGNHDQLVQGNFVHNSVFENRAIGNLKGNRTVTADPNRRLLSRTETVAEHFTTTGLPLGHGFTEENRTNGTAYYTFDRGPVRFVVMDTVNANGGSEGSLDATQFSWLQEQLATATDKLVIVSSHHTSWTMDNPAGGNRVFGAAVVQELLSHENVIAWVNGHTHSNTVRARARSGGGGFWEINTASHIDWPQQSRIIEIVDNEDATLSIFTTMLDHGAGLGKGTKLNGPMKLAALGRLLAANDYQERENHRRGRSVDRNVELLLPAPAFMR